MDYKTKSIFYRQMGVMLKSGLSLLKALDNLSSGRQEKPLRETTSILREGVVSGKSLAGQMEICSGVFTRLETSVVLGGERSGNLAEVFTQLAVHFEFLQNIKSKLISGMVYPVFLLHAAIIIPAVPALILKGPVQFFKAVIPPFILIYGCAAAVIVFRKTISHSSPAAQVWDAFVIRVPVFGKLIITISMVRFLQAFTSLYVAGIGVIESVQISAQAMGNSLMEKEMLKSLLFLKIGKLLSESLVSNRYIPPVVLDMLKSGEVSGKMDETLSRVSGYLQDEVETTVQRVITILPVIIYLLVAMYVAFIVISFYSRYLGQVGSFM